MGFVQLPVVPPVADDAVAGRGCACQVISLRGAGDGGKGRHNARRRASRSELRDAGRSRADEGFRQADDIDDRRSIQHTRAIFCA